jgi:hypothetical protein
MMLSDSLTDYWVIRTTTDKLSETLNGYSRAWKIQQITHTGGRDWVVIAACEWESLLDKCEAHGEDLEDWA